MQNTHSLKAGDKVICTKDYGNQFTKGRVYEVSHKPAFGTVYVTLDDSGSVTNGWNCEFFEKVEEQPAKYRVTETEKSGSYYVQRRVEHWHTLTNGTTKAEAKVICDALNAAEAA